MLLLAAKNSCLPLFYFGLGRPALKIKFKKGEIIMMDELKTAILRGHAKHQKPFSEEGVTANLTQWYEQKQGFYEPV